MTYRTLPARVGERPYPLLLLLHGRGADEDDLVGVAEELDPRFAVISLRAPLQWAVGYAWYENLPSGAPKTADLERGLALVRRTVEAEVARGDADPQRVFALGFSQGAVMVGATLLTGTVELAGGVMLSGALPSAEGLNERLDGLAGRHVFLGHGRYDEVIPASASRDAADFLRLHGAGVTLNAYDVAHQISLEELRDVDAWLRERLDAPCTAWGSGLYSSV